VGLRIADWQKSLQESLLVKGIAGELFAAGDALLMKFKDAEKLVLNLIPVSGHIPLEELIDLASSYHDKGIQLIQLWEDVWESRPLQVLGRISSLLGMNKTIHGRKTKVTWVSQPEADLFFEQFHLQGSASARYKYALTLDNVSVAMASFSAKRRMTRRAEAGYTSVELIRFATMDGITVQGGLSKLIRHLIRAIAPNDVMTYTDQDWSYGKGYERLGFELVARSAAAEIFLDTESMTRYFPHRLPAALGAALKGMSAAETQAYLHSKHYLRIYNTGNLKYVLYL
jgi:hypothetical protein